VHAWADTAQAPVTVGSGESAGVLATIDPDLRGTLLGCQEDFTPHPRPVPFEDGLVARPVLRLPRLRREGSPRARADPAPAPAPLHACPHAGESVRARDRGRRRPGRPCPKDRARQRRRAHEAPNRPVRTRPRTIDGRREGRGAGDPSRRGARRASAAAGPRTSSPARRRPSRRRGPRPRGGSEAGELRLRAEVLPCPVGAHDGRERGRCVRSGVASCPDGVRTGSTAPRTHEGFRAALTCAAATALRSVRARDHSSRK
jgi:hypothetical protein